MLTEGQTKNLDLRSLGPHQKNSLQKWSWNHKAFNGRKTSYKSAGEYQVLRSSLNIRETMLIFLKRISFTKIYWNIDEMISAILSLQGSVKCKCKRENFSGVNLNLSDEDMGI